MFNISQIDLDFSEFKNHEYDLCLRTYGIEHYKCLYYPFLPGEKVDEELNYSVSIPELKSVLPCYYYTLNIEKQFKEIDADDGYSSFIIFFHQPTFDKNATVYFIDFIQRLGYKLVENKMKDDLIYLTFKAKYKQSVKDDVYIWEDGDVSVIK